MTVKEIQDIDKETKTTITGVDLMDPADPVAHKAEWISKTNKTMMVEVKDLMPDIKLQYNKIGYFIKVDEGDPKDITTEMQNYKKKCQTLIDMQAIEPPYLEPEIYWQPENPNV